MGVPLVPTTADPGDSGGVVAVDMQSLAVREALRTAKEAFKLQEDAQYGKARLRSSDGMVRTCGHCVTALNGPANLFDGTVGALLAGCPTLQVLQTGTQPPESPATCLKPLDTWQPDTYDAYRRCLWKPHSTTCS